MRAGDSPARSARTVRACVPFAIHTSLSGSRNGRGRTSSALATLNTVALAPTPSAMMATALIVNADRGAAYESRIAHPARDHRLLVEHERCARAPWPSSRAVHWRRSTARPDAAMPPPWLLPATSRARRAPPRDHRERRAALRSASASTRCGVCSGALKRRRTPARMPPAPVLEWSAIRRPRAQNGGQRAHIVHERSRFVSQMRFPIGRESIVARAPAHSCFRPTPH